MDTQKILIVDDETPVRKVLCRLFSRKGYEAFTASDGIEALEKIKENRPDLMILDLGMPRKEGMGVLTDLKDDKNRPAVLILTAHSDVELAKKTVSLGAYDYLLKPCGIEDIKKSVDRMLEEIRNK